MLNCLLFVLIQWMREKFDANSAKFASLEQNKIDDKFGSTLKWNFTLIYWRIWRQKRRYFRKVSSSFDNNQKRRKRDAHQWIIHPLMTTTCVLIAVYLCLIFDCLIIAYCWTGIPTGELREFHKNYNETETET